MKIFPNEDLVCVTTIVSIDLVVLVHIEGALSKVKSMRHVALASVSMDIPISSQTR